MTNTKQLTIAQFLKVNSFPFAIKDKNGNQIYYESSDGFWLKREFNVNNNEIYGEDSKHAWSKQEYDANNNEIYCENSYGSWIKREFDAKNNEIYYEDSGGKIIDNRIVELTMDEIALKFGITVKQLKIKK